MSFCSAEQKLITDERFIGLVKEYDMEYIIEDTDDIVTSNIEGVDRISEIVNGLKTFSHQGETNFSALPIGQIVSAALNVVNNEVKYKHDVQHILSEQDIYIFGKLTKDVNVLFTENMLDVMFIFHFIIHDV